MQSIKSTYTEPTKANDKGMALIPKAIRKRYDERQPDVVLEENILSEPVYGLDPNEYFKFSIGSDGQIVVNENYDPVVTRVSKGDVEVNGKPRADSYPTFADRDYWRALDASVRGQTPSINDVNKVMGTLGKDQYISPSKLGNYAKEDKSIPKVDESLYNPLRYAGWGKEAISAKNNAVQGIYGIIPDKQISNAYYLSDSPDKNLYYVLDKNLIGIYSPTQQRISSIDYDAAPVNKGQASQQYPESTIGYGHGQETRYHKGKPYTVHIGSRRIKNMLGNENIIVAGYPFEVDSAMPTRANKVYETLSSIDPKGKLWSDPNHRYDMIYKQRNPHIATYIGEDGVARTTEMSDGVIDFSYIGNDMSLPNDGGNAPGTSIEGNEPKQLGKPADKAFEGVAADYLTPAKYKEMEKNNFKGIVNEDGSRLTDEDKEKLREDSKYAKYETTKDADGNTIIIEKNGKKRLKPQGARPLYYHKQAFDTSVGTIGPEDDVPLDAKEIRQYDQLNDKYEDLLEKQAELKLDDEIKELASKQNRTPEEEARLKKLTDPIGRGIIISAMENRGDFKNIAKADIPNAMKRSEQADMNYAKINTFRDLVRKKAKFIEQSVAGENNSNIEPFTDEDEMTLNELLKDKYIKNYLGIIENPRSKMEARKEIANEMLKIEDEPHYVQPKELNDEEASYLNGILDNYTYNDKAKSMEEAFVHDKTKKPLPMRAQELIAAANPEIVQKIHKAQDKAHRTQERKRHKDFVDKTGKYANTYNPDTGEFDGPKMTNPVGNNDIKITRRKGKNVTTTYIDKYGNDVTDKYAKVTKPVEVAEPEPSKNGINKDIETVIMSYVDKKGNEVNGLRYLDRDGNDITQLMKLYHKDKNGNWVNVIGKPAPEAIAKHLPHPYEKPQEVLDEEARTGKEMSWAQADKFMEDLEKSKNGKRIFTDSDMMRNQGLTQEQIDTVNGAVKQYEEQMRNQREAKRPKNPSKMTKTEKQAAALQSAKEKLDRIIGGKKTTTKPVEETATSEPVDNSKYDFLDDKYEKGEDGRWYVKGKVGKVVAPERVSRVMNLKSKGVKLKSSLVPLLLAEIAKEAPSTIRNFTNPSKEEAVERGSMEDENLQESLQNMFNVMQSMNEASDDNNDNNSDDSETKIPNLWQYITSYLA